MHLVLTTEPKDDIAQAVAWYGERSGRAADEFLVAVGKALERIEAQPTAQGVVDRGSGARRALLRKFPHRVLYLVEAEQIVIVAVIHHRRDGPAWRARLE